MAHFKANESVGEDGFTGNISLCGVAGGRPLNLDEGGLLGSRLKNRVVSNGMACTIHIRHNRFNQL